MVDIVAGTTTIIEGPEVLRDGKVSKRFAAYDVSNDGTIVGTYYDPNTTHIGSNGAESSREMPCMYKDGVFTTLAKLEDSEYFNYETSNARGMSADGNTIVGQCLMPAGYGGAVREVLTGFILELSDLTSIKKVALTQTEVSVAVNNSILSIASLNGTERIESMRVYAAGGNQIISQENINSTNLDVNMSAYAAGIYVVRVVTDKGTLAKKIVLKK